MQASDETTSYSFATFGQPNAIGTWPVAINNGGEAVGYSRSVNNPIKVPGYYAYYTFDGFVYDNGTFTTADAPASAASEALGINDRGEIIGYYVPASDYSGSGPYSGVVGYMDQNGGYTTLVAPGAAVTIPLGIDNRGEIVGYYINSGSVSSLAQSAFKYSHGTFTTIDPPGATVTSAIAVNNRGDVLETSDNQFVVYHDGTYTDINLPGTALTTIFQPPSYEVYEQPLGGINDRGEVVGSYENSSGNTVGFLYNRGTVTTLAAPGADTTEALAINDKGEIAGYYSSNSLGIVGFVYDHGTFDTIAVPGATATWAVGINNSGQVLGYYDDSTGTHGFIASFESAGYGSCRFTAWQGAPGEGQAPDLGGFLKQESANLGKDDLVPGASWHRDSGTGGGASDPWAGGLSGVPAAFGSLDPAIPVPHSASSAHG